jgi:hypothetical protein
MKYLALAQEDLVNQVEVELFEGRQVLRYASFFLRKLSLDMDVLAKS